MGDKDKKNQTSWKPGQSGNPNGRPKGDRSIRAILRELGEARITITDTDGNKKQVERYKAVLMRAYQMALAGDMAAIKFIANYRDGMPPQDINLGNGEPGERRAFVVNVMGKNGKAGSNGNGNGNGGA